MLRRVQLAPTKEGDGNCLVLPSYSFDLELVLEGMLFGIMNSVKAEIRALVVAAQLRSGTSVSGRPAAAAAEGKTAENHPKLDRGQRRGVQLQLWSLGAGKDHSVVRRNKEGVNWLRRAEI